MPILGSLGAATAKGVGFTAVPAELPGTPTIGTATVTGGVSVSVSYTAPTFDGNTSILSYTAVAYNYPSGTASGITGIAYGPNSGSVIVTGLTSGAAYTFKVFATNGIGNSGLSSASNNVTTWMVPTAPTIGSVTYTAGNSFASVAYTAPSSNGGTPVTSYTALAYIGGGVAISEGPIYQSGSGSITVNGLIGNLTYTFKVYASNLVGNSPTSNASSPSTVVVTKPDAPTIGTATYTSGTTASVSFTAPANNGGASISSYTVRAYINGVITALSASGSISPLGVNGLTKGTTYTFRVTATNIYGTSNASNDSNAITPLTVPSAPTIGTPAATSGTVVAVNFTAPTDTGGNSTYITSYTATSTPGNISVTKTTDLPSPGSAGVINIPGLTKGQTYTFTVYATNPIGNSANSGSSTTVTPADVPNAPTLNLVTTSTANTGSTGFVTVNFSAPSDNGGATITSYTAVSTPGGITASVFTASSGTVTVTGLTKGTAYTFVIYATNRVGNSANSNTSSSITPLTFPAAPTIGTATATGPDSATVTFTAPTDTGGSTITNYTATSSPSATLIQSITSAGVITITNGLTKGQTYTFTVYATNPIGIGATSGSSGSITTWTEPGAPTIGTATEVNATTATIAFTAGTTGGTFIIDYTATAYISGVATAITVTGISSPITVTGLTQGTTYTFKVTARNSVGSGPASSDSNTVQPADRPSKPTAPTVSTSTTYTADGRVSIAFTAPFNGGTTILDYSFVSSPATTTRTVTQAGGGTYLFTGLVKGTAYTFSYAARNRIGIGTYSDASASITPLTVPSAPGIGTAIRYDATTVTVGYTASSDNGGTTITGYTATSTPGGITGSVLGTGGGTTLIFVTGLTKGTPYTFTVRATNSRGSSIESSSSNSATPATIPDAPTIGTATTVSKNSISVSFTAPADNGGNSIFAYTAVSSPGGISNTINQAGSGTITVNGLNPATAYTFIVYATNTYGASANSASSNSTTTLNSYAVSASPTSINESSNRTVTFTISTIGVANGSTLYWTNTGTTNAADFTDSTNDGSFTISASGSPPVGSASVTRTTVADLFTEGTQTIVFNVQSTPGTTEATATVNVLDTSLTPTPTYSIVPDQYSINETTNRTVTFTVTTTYVPNGTTLYWQTSNYLGTVSAADFTGGALSGSMTISGASGTPQTGGTASFSLTAATDKLTDASQEAFVMYLGTASPAYSNNVAVTSAITIVDTSLTPGVVTISPTTASRNIVFSGVAQTITGTYVTTMSSGTPGTITNQEITSLSVFSEKSVSPTTRTFTGTGQTQTASWSVTTVAVEYSNPSYNITFASVLDTADPDISNNYPTHAITLNRIAYTQNITVSPTSGYTNSTFTYTITGAPGTQVQYQNSVGGPLNTATLSGSVGGASAGTYSESAAFWTAPGTYTLYVKWLATNHGDSFFGASSGYATNTRATVTVTYPPLSITAGFIIGSFWQISRSGPWTGQPTFTASGGSGSGYSFATPGLPSGIVQSSSTGTLSGTPTVAGNTAVTTTVTDSASNTASVAYTIYVANYPTITSAATTTGRTAFTVGESVSITWASSNTASVIIISTSNFVANTVATSGSFSLSTPSAGSFIAYVYPVFFNGELYTAGAVGVNYAVYAAATITFGATVNAPPYNSSTAASLSVKAGATAYYNWTSTNATAVTYYISTNGSGFTGPNAVGLQGPSGPLILGDVTITSNTYFTLYLQAVNGAGAVVNSQQSTITWTPYNEVLSISPSTTFSGASGCLLTVTGCYPNESIGFSINNTSYTDGTVTANSSGTFTNPSAFAGSTPGTYTLYIKMATTTHTRQVTITAT